MNTENMIDKTVMDLNEILWGLESMKEGAQCLRRNGTTEEELSYDHLLILGECGIDKMIEKVTGLLGDYERYSLQEINA